MKNQGLSLKHVGKNVIYSVKFLEKSLAFSLQLQGGGSSPSGSTGLRNPGFGFLNSVYENRRGTGLSYLLS